MIRVKPAPMLLMLVLVGAGSAPTAILATPGLSAQTATFNRDERSSGWIDFNLLTNVSIFVPVRINGQDVAALLYGGGSVIDTEFAARAGLKASADASAPVAGLDVQIGDLTLHTPVARAIPIASPRDNILAGRPLVLYLGKEVFEQLVVDIDFANHRVAFLDRQHLIRPAGAVKVPLQLKGDAKEKQWVVPLSVDGAPAAWFEVELGNVIGPLMTTRAYAEGHKLFDNHPTSQRLSGKYHETVVSIDHLTFAGLDFPHAPIAIIPDTELPPDGVTGGLGLPLMSHFHLIFDYPHHRLFAIPNATVAGPIPKDRIGLVLSSRPVNPNEANFTVLFVAPGSPAETAGFKIGDQMIQIDGKTYQATPLTDLIAFPMAAPGVLHTFIMADGSTRTVTAKDFF
jgi:hypothetical protein